MSSKRPRDSHRGSATCHPAASDRFDRALRTWAERPPRTLPAEAARRIVGELPERLPTARTRPPVRLWLAVAAAIFVVGVGLTLFLGPARGPARGAPTAPPPGVPVSPAGDVLVIELDSETLLYMNLSEGDPS